MGRDDFEIIIVNIVNQDDLFDTLKTITNNEFIYVQDTPALNIWKNMNAKKDDIVIFKRDGTQKIHLSMSNKRKEIFLGPKDGARCEIVDQVQPITHLLEALGESGVPASCDDVISGSGSGDEDIEIIEESSGSGSGEEEELTIEEMKKDIAYMVKELQAARKKLRQAIIKRKEMKKSEREAKRAARKNKKEQRKKKKMGGGMKKMSGNDKNMSMGGNHDGH